MALNSLGPDQIRIFVDTHEKASFDETFAVIFGAIDALKSLDDFSADVQIVPNEFGQGTWWVHLLVIGGSVGAAVAGAQGLLADIRSGQAPFASAIVQLIDGRGGSETTISTSETLETIKRTDIPLPTVAASVGNATARSSAEARSGWGKSWGENWGGQRASGLTFDGDPLTFQGEQLAFGNAGAHDDPWITITRTTGTHPVTEDGRPVELIDGSIVHGTKKVRRSALRFIDMPPAGLAVSANGAFGEGSRIQVLGRMDTRPTDETEYFRTGTAVLEVRAVDNGTLPPRDVPVIATVQFYRDRPNEMTIHAWEPIES